jgi:hypothetical protein
MEETPPGQSSIPLWAWEPVARVAGYIKQDRDLVDVSVLALTQMPLIAVVLASAQKLTDQITDEGVREAERIAELAQVEIKDNFRRLFGHSLSSVWGALEAMADDLFVAFLVNEPRHLQRQELGKVKVPLGEFLRLQSDEERIEELLTQMTGQLPRTGIDRFESRLDLIWLSGTYNGEMAERIYEVQQIRNAFVHRGGTADRKFVKACPQLGFSVGDPIGLTREQYDAYVEALLRYVQVVSDRVIERFQDAPQA